MGYAKSLLAAIKEFKSDQKLVIFDFGSGFGHSLILSEALGHTAYGIEIDNKGRTSYSNPCESSDAGHF